LDFWRILTSRDNRSSTLEKLDPENMGIALGILLLCVLELEICLGVKSPPTCWQTSQKTVARQGLIQTAITEWMDCIRP